MIQALKRVLTFDSWSPRRHVVFPKVSIRKERSLHYLGTDAANDLTSPSMVKNPPRAGMSLLGAPPGPADLRSTSAFLSPNFPAKLLLKVFE
ncbi:Uncharacterized protein TCM_022289 [Theobroma cacao]|uniref:Uncharacterized protein n=1 Tax=Theobroma cacao TaxID=3641 RepID=A0A061ESZ3_THECC|nr:Uncharacterized protein TCM_022289 [Theobroma cacao]